MLKTFKDDPLLKGLFPDSLKLANITPVHKKNKPTHKENYIQVSTLLLMSKIFERLTYDQLNEYLKQYLNIVLCGVRKAHSTQHTLLRLLQKIRGIPPGSILGHCYSIYLSKTSSFLLKEQT